MINFRWNILYVLAGNGPMKGVSLKAELEDYYEKEIYHGRMYPNLNTLVDRGLIDKEERDKRTLAFEAARRELVSRRDAAYKGDRRWSREGGRS